MIVSNYADFKCEYNRTRWECLVSFNLINNSSTLRSGTLSVRGMGFKAHGKTKAVILSEDKFVDFEIPGNETMSIREVVNSERKPKTISIKIIEKKYMD